MSTSEAAASERPKMRQCLRCDARFESAWAGERVCGSCKGSRAWKSGETLRSVPSRSSHARTSSRSD